MDTRVKRMIGEHAGSLLCLAVFITVCLLAAFVTKVRVWKPRFRNVFEKNPRQAVSDTQEIGLADTQPEIEPLGHTHPRAGAILNIKACLLYLVLSTRALS
ncbi:hypothetical protein ACJMK2_009063 [Sinanodonta woodiana]|uniref:Uncharacterized protein n=1 Tax=Sinanodonta woodiana TaxID=1069815 RepID=A0ABD3VBC4_SINWO